MASREELVGRVREFAQELTKEMGELEVSEQECWLTVVEDLAVELGDTVTRSVVEHKCAAQAARTNGHCPKCGKLGRFRGDRQRSLQTRRGAATIREPEYYCPCCRKAFFPDDRNDWR